MTPTPQNCNWKYAIQMQYASPLGFQFFARLLALQRMISLTASPMVADIGFMPALQIRWPMPRSTVASLMRGESDQFVACGLVSFGWRLTFVIFLYVVVVVVTSSTRCVGLGIVTPRYAGPRLYRPLPVIGTEPASKCRFPAFKPGGAGIKEGRYACNTGR